MLKLGGITIIQIGKFNHLRINNFASVGLYLDAETGNMNDNVLLPGKEIPAETGIGDYLDVFIYHDSEDRLIATLRKPLATVGDIAYLQVTAKSAVGAFLDFGLERGLFLPFSEQKFPIEVDHSYLVYIYIDKSGRLCCTTDIYEHLTAANATYQKNDKVTGTVYLVRKSLGAFVAVDNKYKGLIPPTEYFRDLKSGERIEARVIRVREDGKLDLSLRNLSYLQMDEDAELLLQIMEKNEGMLPLNEKATPKEIEQQFSMSKAAFKRAIGNLLKASKIAKTDEGYIRV